MQDKHTNTASSSSTGRLGFKFPQSAVWVMGIELSQTVSREGEAPF